MSGILNRLQLSKLQSMERTDEQLVADHLGGDKLALDLLIKRYLKPLYNFTFYYLGDEGEAKDTVQESFVKMWRHLKKFDSKRKFKTWIFEIAKNTALDHLKKKKPLTFSRLSPPADDEDFNFGDNLSDDSPLQDELLEIEMTREAVLAAIENLPPDYRAVLVLRFADQLDFQELAEVLDRPLNTVKSQYRRAVLMLKDGLDRSQ